MQTALTISTLVMNVFAVCTGGLFAMVAGNMPTSAYRCWAIVGVVMLAVTLLTVRVQNRVRAESESESPRSQWFRAVSLVLLIMAWGTMIGALARIYTG